MYKYVKVQMSRKDCTCASIIQTIFAKIKRDDPISPSAAESDAFPPIFIRIWKSWRTAICIVTDESVPARSRERKLADVAEEMKLSPIKRVFFTVLYFFLDSCYIFFFSLFS